MQFQEIKNSPILFEVLKEDKKETTILPTNLLPSRILKNQSHTVFYGVYHSLLRKMRFESQQSITHNSKRFNFPILQQTWKIPE